MKKKGFTLIELLAVIAILAILLIIAIPGVLQMFSKAKKDTFVDQAKSIYNTAQKQYLSDQIDKLTNESSNSVYCYDGNSAADADKLEISGNSAVYYYVVFDSNGKMTQFKVKDGTYGYSTTDTDIQSTDITSDDVVSGENVDDVEIECPVIE